MASSNPAIVFVPGSSAPAESYAAFADQVRFYGFDIELVSLPSIGHRTRLPPATMEEDATKIHSVIEKLADAGKEVVLVYHSYGGVPATQSLKGLSAKERGLSKGGVTRLIYVTAMALVVGKSIVDAAATDTSGWDFVGFGASAPDGYVYLTDYAKAGAINFPELAPEEQVEEAKRLTDHSMASLTSPLSHPGYLDVPVTYLLATEDQVILPATQEQFVQDLEAAGAKVDIVRFESRHSWHVSLPRSTARKILQAFDPSI